MTKEEAYKLKPRDLIVQDEPCLFPKGTYRFSRVSGHYTSNVWVEQIWATLGQVKKEGRVVTPYEGFGLLEWWRLPTKEEKDLASTLYFT